MLLVFYNETSGIEVPLFILGGLWPCLVEDKRPVLFFFRLHLSLVGDSHVKRAHATRPLPEHSA